MNRAWKIATRGARGTVVGLMLVGSVVGACESIIEHHSGTTAASHEPADSERRGSEQRLTPTPDSATMPQAEDAPEAAWLAPRAGAQASWADLLLAAGRTR
jgi:hypothetical protein